MTPEQRRRYLVLTGYGLTRREAREAMGLEVVAEALPPSEAVVIIDEVPPMASPEIWASLPAVDERGRYRGISERVPDPLARYRHGR